MISDGLRRWRQARSVASSQQKMTEAGLARQPGMLVDGQKPWGDQERSGRARNRARALLAGFARASPVADARRCSALQVQQ